MEQRRLRLGDILDDYCPRERRVTNHAVVAMIEEEIKQTRCTTCDAEHAYKGGREPRRRKKDGPAGLYQEVLAGMSESELAVAGATDVPPPTVTETPEPAPQADAIVDVIEEDEPEAPVAPVEDNGSVHRRLIRATLPRPEGQQPEPRQIPDFTIRHNGRGPFRGGMRAPGGNGQGGNGSRPQGRRFGGGSQPGGPPRGAAGRGGGFRGPNSNTPRQGNGKKRSR